MIVDAVVNVSDVEISVSLPDDIDGIVLIDVNNVGYYANVTDGKGIIKLSNLVYGEYDVIARFLGDDKYEPAVNTTSFTVDKKVTPSMDIEVDIPENGSGSVDVDLPDDAGGNVTVVVDGEVVAVVDVINGSADVPIDDLDPGNHTVEVIYSGDDKYDSVSNTTVVSVPRISDYSMNVTASDIIFGDETNIIVELPGDIDGVVLLDIDGVGYYVNVSNGVAEFNVPVDLKVGNYTVVATFVGNDKYDSKSNSTSFTVKGKSVSIDISVNGSDIVIELPDDAGGNVTVVVDGNESVVPVVNGTAVVPVDDLEPGNHSVEVIYSGDDKYGPANETCEVDVPKHVPDVDISSEDNNLIITLPEDATGNVTVVVDGNESVVPVVNGTATVPNINGGNHSVEVVYPGDDKYTSADINGTFYVNGVRMIVNDVVKYYHGPERLVVTLLDNDGKGIASKEVKITINGITYTKFTDVNGMASLGINLPSRNYTAIVEVPEYGFVEDVSVVVLPTIYASDVTKYFHNGTKYYARFVDSEGNPLVNTTVSFNIHGVFYYKTTDESGVATLNINLSPGEYILTAINPVTGEMRTNIVTVYSLIESSDLTKYYRNGSQFVVRVHNYDGSYAGAGKKVTFNVEGRIYTKFTDSDGYVILNINLSPDEYVVTTYYEDCREGNIITVLPTLSASDLTMKYRDGSQFTARVLDGTGLPYAGQTVTFNINGVFYNKITDGNGEAKLNINLSVGEYVITSTYNQVSVSNKITIV